MIVKDALNKAICWFAGGFGYAKMDSEGEVWTYTVKSCSFNDELAMVLLTGEHTANAVLVKEHGHKEFFRMAIQKMPGHERAYE